MVSSREDISFWKKFDWKMANYEDDGSDRSYEDEIDEYSDDDDRNANLIKKVMTKHGVKPSEIPDRSKKQGVKGLGKFDCSNPECDRKWTSRRTSVQIDLQAQEFVKYWKQKCKECEEENEPSFSRNELIGMIEKAIKQEEYFRNRDTEDGAEGGYDDNYEPSGPPHDGSRCEKCCWGEGPPCGKR